MKDLKLENLIQAKDGLKILERGLALNVKRTGEAASADQKSTYEFPCH